MRWYWFIIWGVLFWLMLNWFASSVGLADTKTTNNLITNGNFETGNANGWTTSGDVQVLNDCCELNGVSSNYDLEFGDNGSITQDFNLSTNTITQNMLNNGITLNSTVEIQNGECGVAGCWGGTGNADTFQITLTIKDTNGNVLATTTNTRTDITGINGANFTDTLIYNGVGSNIGNLGVGGSDGNAPANLGGPNLDNIAVTMTYDDTVLAEEITNELIEISEELQEIITNIIYEEFAEEFIMEEPEIMEEIELVSQEMVIEIIEEIQESLPEPAMEEEIEIAQAPEVIEEMEMAEEATEIIEEIFEEELPMIVENEETIEEEKPNEEITEEKTQIVKKKVAVKTQKKKTAKPKIDKIMAKIDAKVKDIDKNLKLKNLIKIDIMTEEQVSLAAYNVPFYKSKDIYLDQLNIQDARKIYTNVSLANYTDNDIMGIKARKIGILNWEKQKLLLELKALKNG